MGLNIHEHIYEHIYAQTDFFVLFSNEVNFHHIYIQHTSVSVESPNSSKDSYAANSLVEAYLLSNEQNENMYVCMHTRNLYIIHHLHALYKLSYTHRHSTHLMIPCESKR